MTAASWWWGVKASRRRIALACTGPAGRFDAIGVPAERWPKRRPPDLAWLELELLGWLRARAAECPPVIAWVEQPAGHAREDPSLMYAVGATIASLQGALDGVLEHEVQVLTVPPRTWKREAVGHGNATAGQVLAWAASRGAPSGDQALADALGVAIAGRRICARGNDRAVLPATLPAPSEKLSAASGFGRGRTAPMIDADRCGDTHG